MAENLKNYPEIKIMRTRKAIPDNKTKAGKFSNVWEYFKFFKQMPAPRRIKEMHKRLEKAGGLKPGEPIPTYQTLLNWADNHKWELLADEMDKISENLCNRVWSMHLECLNFDIKHKLHTAAKTMLDCCEKVATYHASNPEKTDLKQLRELGATVLELLSKSESYEVNHQLAKESMIASVEDEDVQKTVFSIINSAGATENELMKMFDKLPPEVMNKA